MSHEYIHIHFAKYQFLIIGNFIIEESLILCSCFLFFHYALYIKTWPSSPKKKKKIPLHVSRLIYTTQYPTFRVQTVNVDCISYINEFEGWPRIQCRPRITQVFENPHARNNRDNETIERNPPSGSNAVFAPPLLII